MEKIIYMHPFLNLAAFKFIFYQQEYTYPDGKTKQYPSRINEVETHNLPVRIQIKDGRDR